MAHEELLLSADVPSPCFVVDVDKLEAYLFPRDLEREPVRPVTIQPVPYKNPLRW